MAAVQARAELVEWEPSLPRTNRVRVRRHTCVCESPIYELCAAAGLGFVRRIIGDTPTSADESAWLSFRAAEDLWWRILRGKAR
ncbi:hypothetical protein LDL08_32495 [Nonomuraea glycinis]|uniref:hypothetical protein n=1 Tax=Nonomuraea glycinis TaxID=2047744 RepID=UPI0016673E0B|nr:hypothetical protein [Nonomuraea glycinis]MCA2180910.1 hypothetical protein [Nonomuraea glycinis]